MGKQSVSKESKDSNLFDVKKTIYSFGFKERGDGLFTVCHDNSWIYTGDESMIMEACDIMASRLKLTIEQMFKSGLDTLWIESSATDHVYSVMLRKNRVYFQQGYLYGLDLYGNFDTTIEETVEVLKEKLFKVLTAGFLGFFDNIHYVLSVE